MFREAISENKNGLGSRPFQEAGRGQHVQRSCGMKKFAVFKKLASVAGGVGGEGVGGRSRERQAGPDPEALERVLQFLTLSLK